MNLLKNYAGIIGLFFIVTCFQFIPGNEYVIGYGSESVINIFQYLLMILSFILFVFSGIFLLKNYSKYGFWNSLKTQNGKIFLLSFGFLTVLVLQFAAVRLMMDSGISFFNMQIKKQIPEVIINGQPIYANPQPAQVLNKQK